MIVTLLAKLTQLDSKLSIVVWVVELTYLHVVVK